MRLKIAVSAVRFRDSAQQKTSPPPIKNGKGEVFCFEDRDYPTRKAFFYPFFFPLSRFSITMLAMLKKKMFLIPAGVLVGLALLAIVLHRPVTIVVDGKRQEIHTYALNAGWAMHAGCIILSPTSLLTPAISENIGWQATIQVQCSSQVNLYTNAGLAKSFYSIQHT